VHCAEDAGEHPQRFCAGPRIVRNEDRGRHTMFTP
jgi:hypothetical protein